MMKQKTLMLLMLLVLFAKEVLSQGLWIQNGGFFTTEKTLVVLNETNLDAKGEFKASGESKLLLKSANDPIELHGNLLVADLELKGDCDLQTNLTIERNLIFSSGIMDMGINTIFLGGELINEREESFASSGSGGKIRKQASLNKGSLEMPGNMGLKFVVNKDYGEILIYRSHNAVFNGTDYGINRVFSFSQALDLEQIRFQYFNSELNSLNGEEIGVWTKSDGFWTHQKAVSHVSNELLSYGGDNILDISLFFTPENIDVVFPTGFSPNSDGINDFYVIRGVEKYPNNKFVVFNKWGNVVYEANGYQNQWDGKASFGLSIGSDKLLLEGTYFYLFYKDVNDKKEVSKGFFELKFDK